MQSKFQILFSPFLVTVKTFANCLYSHDPPSFCWESPSEAAESSLFEVSSSLLTEQLVEAPWAKGGRCVPFYCDIWTAFVMGLKKINNIHMDLLHPFIFSFSVWTRWFNSSNYFFCTEGCQATEAGVSDPRILICNTCHVASRIHSSTVEMTFIWLNAVTLYWNHLSGLPFLSVGRNRLIAA